MKPAVTVRGSGTVTVHTCGAHSNRIRHIGSLPAAKCRIPGSDSVLAPAKQQVFTWEVNTNQERAVKKRSKTVA